MLKLGRESHRTRASALISCRRRLCPPLRGLFVVVVKFGAEYLDDLLFVGDHVSLHDVHARTEQSFERSHVEHWTNICIQAVYITAL